MRSLLPICLATLLGIAPAGASRPVETQVRYLSNHPRPANVFIVAHEDDWQLFMGDVVADKVRKGGAIVIVYLTAGDVGRNSTYWRARENAALESTRILFRSSGDPPPECGAKTVGSHSIQRCSVANSISWFMRLPDGRRNGRGYKNRGYQSLRRIQAGRINTITSVDGENTYNGWNDVVATVRSIIAADSATTATLHANDPNIVINPHDHYDHRIAGRLAAELERRDHHLANYYLGYAVIARDDNLSPKATRTKAELFEAYDRTMVAANAGWSALAEHRTFYSECLKRTYFRRSENMLRAR